MRYFFVCYFWFALVEILSLYLLIHDAMHKNEQYILEHFKSLYSKGRRVEPFTSSVV